MRFYLTLAILFVTFVTQAQFSEDFTDGDFILSPTWSGMEGNFEVNEVNQLHLLAPETADTSYLCVNSTLINGVTWDFWVKMEFNPSSSNNTRVYLVSDQENLKGELNGYFVMVGNTADEISLYRQTGTSITEILDGIDGTVDTDDVEVRIRVTRDLTGNWELFHDNTGGYAFISEGSVFDDTYTSTAYFGVFCKYTSSRSELFYFDELGAPYVDAVPPLLENLEIISNTELDLLFSEPLDPTLANSVGNYILDNGIGNPLLAELDGINPALVHLTVGTAFSNGTDYEIMVENIEDLEGNIIETTAVSFLYVIPVPAEYNDLIFTELMIDPNPVIGLPEVEFIEIYNRSDKHFDLTDWTINDDVSTATLGAYLLPPDEYLIICGDGEGVLFGIENVLEVTGLPTLTNGGDQLVIADSAGVAVDSINYLQSWYADVDKEDGGWTLERKHLNAPCSDKNNWAASIALLGGTPGLQNSIWTDEDDISSPSIESFIVLNDAEIELIFNESVDTIIPLTIFINPPVDILMGEYTSVNSFMVNAITLQPNTTYELSISNGQDCWGNEIDETIIFGIPGEIAPGDLIINEILFDPKTGGSDYVELVNISDKIIDLNRLYIANWNDSIANYELIGDTQHLLLPNQYITLTEDSAAVINDFSIYGVGRFIDTDLPTFPNDSGTVFLMGPDSLLIDYFHYDADYHYALLNSTDGKSLERITFGGGMNNPNNWHTASENLDWGTPGYLNSQFASPNTVGEVSLDPKLFSPDSDGYNDVLTINFDLIDIDNNIDLAVYDNQGRLIRQLADNYFIGQSGVVIWDGINDNGEKAAIGSYIILATVKNSTGIRTQFKLVAVLAGQF